MTCCYYTIIYDEHVMSKQKTKIENNKGGNWSAKKKSKNMDELRAKRDANSVKLGMYKTV